MKKIEKVILLGSGALKIGEAGEFDYSGTQAIKALKEEGIQVILVNPNIATIQTSPGLADEVYFYPVTPQFVEEIIKREKPDGIMISFGGQTALNCGMELHRQGVFEKYNVTVLGSPIQAVIDTEDRKLFSEALAKHELLTAKGKTVSSLAEAMEFARSLGYPVMMRTGFALGGTGSGIIENEKELETRVSKALSVFPQIVIEECLYGWKEIEYEVVRDIDDNCITVCNMENFDPTGIHTGESIVVAPSQTLTDHEYYQLRAISIKAIRAFGIVGECNIQYALNPKNGEYRIIEVNARLSRSSALASKATGYPLAYVAAKLALGKRLWEIPNKVTGKTTAYFEPALDYIIVKIPRWDIDKFTYGESNIGSEMKSVGEVMSIARTFEEAIQKGTRMLNDGYAGVIDKQFEKSSLDTLRKKLKTPNTMRLFTICSALNAGMTVDEVHSLTKIDTWFLEKLAAIVAVYQELSRADHLSVELLKKAKIHGFSDQQLASIFSIPEEEIHTKRVGSGIIPYVKRIDTTAGEFPAQTNYLYMTYSADSSDHIPDEKEEKICVLGAGPYAIGTSVEFDWCAVNAMKTIRELGYKGIMVNCNPETVSTDFDHSDYLYFEELSVERVRDIYDSEKAPIMISMGGQIPNNLAQKLSAYSIPLLGATAAQIKMAEQRQEFSELLDSLEIQQPRWDRARSVEDAKKLTQNLCFPMLVRPSFVLSGKAMRVLYSPEELDQYMQSIDFSLSDHPLLMTEYLQGATEFDFDGVADNGKVILTALSRHVEGAGVHSGDSASIYPSYDVCPEHIQEMNDATELIISTLKLSGPFNIQYLIHEGNLYVIECNVRASRSFPFVSKVQGVNFISLATKILLNKKYEKPHLSRPKIYGVKVPQFSFQKLRGSDPVLKVEMNSTGEVATFSDDPYDAYFLSLMATGMKYPVNKAIFVSIGGKYEKMKLLKSLRHIADLGFTIYSTSGTHLFLRESGIKTIYVDKIHEGQDQTVLDLIKERQIDAMFIVPQTIKTMKIKSEVNKGFSDGYRMRRSAIDYGIPTLTHIDSIEFLLTALSKYYGKEMNVLPYSAYVKINTF